MIEIQTTDHIQETQQEHPIETDSWKIFLKTKGKYLLFKEFIDSVAGTYVNVFFITTFITVLNDSTLRMMKIIEPITLLIGSFLIVRFKIEKISLTLLSAILLISYSFLFIMCVDYNIYYIVNGTLCFNILFRVMKSRIRSENVVQEHRIKFNNNAELYGSIGQIIGGLFGLYPIINNFSLLQAWFILYIMMDISFLLMLILIKFKILKY